MDLMNHYPWFARPLRGRLLAEKMCIPSGTKITEGDSRWWCSASSTSNPGSERRAVALGKVDRAPGSEDPERETDHGQVRQGNTLSEQDRGCREMETWCWEREWPGVVKVRAVATDARAGLSADMAHPSWSSQGPELSSLCDTEASH